MSEYNFDGIPDDNEFEGESQSQYDLSGIPDDDDSADVSISLQQKYNSANQNPDQIATAKRHAEKAGIPMLVAQNQPDKAAKLANAPDWTRLTKDAPITARTLSNDGTFFQIAHDDHETLGAIEQGLLTLGKAVPVVGQAVQAVDTTKKLIEGMTGISLMGDKDDVGTVVKKYAENWDNQARKTMLGLSMAADSALAQFLAPNAGEGIDGWYYRQNKNELDGVVDEIAGLADSSDPIEQNRSLQLAQEYGFDSVPRTIGPGNVVNRRKLLDAVIDKRASAFQANTNAGIIAKNKRRAVLVDMVKDEDKALQENAAQVDAYTVPWLVSNSMQFVDQMVQAFLTGGVGSIGAKLLLGAGKTAAKREAIGAAGSAFGQGAGFVAPVFGNEYATGKASGKTDDAAAIDAGASALIEGTTEMIGLKSIEDAAKGLLPILQGVGRATGTNFSQEQAAEIAGQVYDGFANDKHVEQPDYIKGLDAPEPVKQFLAILDQQLQAGVIGAAGGGAMAGTGAGVKAGVDKYNERKQAKLDEQVQQAREQIDAARTRSSQIIETIEKIRTSKLKARDTSSLKALIQSIGDAENDAPTAMLLSADAFKQGGIDPELFKRAVPSAADQVDRAIELGGTIAIDIGELANITDSEVEQGLIPHLKVREEEWTQFEAEIAEIETDEAMAEMQEAADQAAREADQQDDWSRQVDEIRTKYEEQLNKVGQYDKAANKKMAALVSAFYSTTASKLAKHDKTMTPIRLFNEAMMRTQGGLAGGLVFRQGQSFDSVKEAWSSAGIDGQIFENGDVITVSKIVVPKDKRGAVAVTKAMRQLIDYADANGKHIVLSPSGDFGGDVKRLKKFYKGMGFVENKGKNRAFSTMETMYRQADGKLLYQPGIDSGNDESRVKDKADGEGQGNDTVSETQSRIVQWANSVGLHGRTGISTVGRSYSEASRYKGEFSGKSNPFISADERITTAEEGRAEQERLISTAKENGFFLGFGHPFFESLEVYESHGGMEHDAYIVGDAPNKVVIRSTTKGEFGHANKHSPADYLKRIDNYNKLFPDLKIEMIGVHQDSDGSAQIWTAQKFAPGNPFKSDAELDAALRKKGWYQEGISAPGLPKRYKHKESGAIIADVHPDNILHDGDNLYPIDVIVEKLPDRLYQNESAPRGAFDPNTLNITLLEGADLSTFLHESGHFFLEMYARYADQSAEIGADMDALLKWFGVKGDDQAARLAAWRAMSVDQQRAMHERFAESFEQYLFTGKAPSIALQPAFASFRRWLADVYKSLARFVAGHSGAKLNPEIAAVMDRMLATQDQIDEMTQARDSRPLFANADQAGMTQAQWDAYMQDQVRSVEQAADTLVARSLRDMKWLTNAKNKQLRKLQREAQVLRAQVQMEARRTVLSSPEYRAWLFLKRATEKKAKKPANSKTVDPSQDSLLAAIAKLGGLDMEEVVSSWGSVPADFNKKSGVFGKPVLRKKGGLSIETIAEKLLEEGYLTPDQHGKVDLAEFEEKLDRAARGEPMYSMFADYDLLLYGDEKRAAMPRREDVDYIGGRLNRNDLVDMYGTNNPEVKWHRPIDMAGRPFQGGGNIENKTSIDAMAAEGVALNGEAFYQDKDEDQKEPGAVRNLESMGMVSDDGLHPDVVAELFGLSSGDELVRKLLEIDDPFTAVDKLTDKIMMERHSEFTDQKELERMAEAAIHNEARVRFVATELAMLNKAEGGQKDLKRIIDAARLYAQDLLAGQRIQDIRPSKHAADAARAGKESAREFAKGNLAATIMAKRNQVLHTELVRQAHAAKDEVDKGLKYFARIEKAVNNGVLDADYAQQIIGLLQQHDLRKSVSLIDLERRESLAAWVQAQQDAGFEPMIPENLLMEAAKTHYKRMTLDEFRELVDAIKNIEHLGRLKYKLVQNARKRELAAAAAEIGEAIADNATGEVQTRLEKNSVKDRIFDLANGFLYMHRKFASLIRQMDGWKDGGVLWDYFVKTMNDAGDREAVMREQATMAMADLMKPLHESGGFGMMPKKLFITQIGTSLTREGRLMVALNWGNEGNRQRLMDGEGWDVNQVNAVLATLNAEDWKFVQGVWDHLETYRPMVGEQQKRLSGVEPKWIEASPFMVAGKDGQTYELRGGYLPVKYDADRSTKSLTQEALSNIMDQHKAVRAKTRDSFTKGRAAKVVNRPLRKDFGVIFQHMTEVTHRLAWQDWLMDSKRLLAQPAVDEAVRKHYGPAMVEELQKTLDDIATGEVGPANEFEAAINHLRTGTTVAGLGLNFMTSLMQPLGLTQSMVRIGPTWVMKGLAKWGRMEDALPWIYERSDFMRLRGKTFQREINEELNKIRSPKRSAFSDMMFILIQKGQIIADVPTWLGAYEKAIAEQGPNIDEKLAAKLADQAVLDAQSGGMQKDLARIQRGGSLQRLFTMFYSYFSSTYNLSVESVRKVNVKDPATIMSAAIDFLLLYSIPAAIGTAMKFALTGDDDEDEFWHRMALDQVSYFLAVMVGLREFGAVVSGFSGYSGPAGTRFFNEAAKLATQIGQGDMDAAMLKALNNVGGILFHYPAGQINRTVQGASALLNDETDNPAALLFGSRK